MRRTCCRRRGARFPRSPDPAPARDHDRGAQPRIARQPFGCDPVVDRLAEGRRHVGIVHRLRAVEHIADRVAGAELVERPALHHRKIAAGLAIGRPPVGPAGQRHVRRIAGEIEAIDGPAHDLFFPVIVEIRQQRGARSAHGGMDIAVDPRGRHRCSLGRHSWRQIGPPFKCAADGPEAQGLVAERPPKKPEAFRHSADWRNQELK